MRLAVVLLSAAQKGFVLRPKRWGVERSNAWAARFRRLARDYEQVPRHSRACILWPSLY
jgi:transposase